MGLDMYLEKKTYVKNWRHTGAKERHTICVLKGEKVHESIKPERISYIIEEVCTWRKANAIHAWFVRNVQKGEDDCDNYYVSTEQLKALKAECDKVLAASEMVDAPVHVSTVSEHGGPWKNVYEPGKAIADRRVAEATLPTQSGFFFGHTDYDQYYMEDLRRTSEVIGELLAEPGAEAADFYYKSSW